VGSTLYADRGPLLRPPGIVWPRGETPRVFCQSYSRSRSGSSRITAMSVSPLVIDLCVSAGDDERGRGGDTGQGRGWPPRVWADQSRFKISGEELGTNRALQVLVQRYVRGLVTVNVGRRFVPPAERPSTGVGVEMGRERPRLRTAFAAPTPAAGSLTPHVPVSVTCWGARLCSRKKRVECVWSCRRNSRRK
jgi:hypothetical protein